MSLVSHNFAESTKNGIPARPQGFQAQQSIINNLQILKINIQIWTGVKLKMLNKQDLSISLFFYPYILYLYTMSPHKSHENMRPRVAHSTTDRKSLDAQYYTLLKNRMHLLPRTTVFTYSITRLDKSSWIKDNSRVYNSPNGCNYVLHS